MTINASPAAKKIFARGINVAGFFAIVAVFVIPGFFPSWFSLPLQWAWLGSAALLIAFCAVIGIAINGRCAGLIIDNRNRISLSKFQSTAWTILILSAFITMVFARLAVHNVDASAVAVSLTPQLLAVMGISATSLVATPVILSVKAGETPAEGQLATTASNLGDNVDNLSPAGKVYARKNPADAKWLDMFRGEEVSNADSPDLGKLQQFLITIVVLTVYGVSIWVMLEVPYDKTASWLGALPALSDNMVWLIGVSHAGYLAYKAVPHGASAAGS